jgi:hypothetical protein
MFIMGGIWTVAGILMILATVVWHDSGADAVLGGIWLWLAVGYFAMAFGRRRREQRGPGHVPSELPPEVRLLAEQGRKIEAIKRYRQLNPGVGLREAKKAVDGL